MEKRSPSRIGILLAVVLAALIAFGVTRVNEGGWSNLGVTAQPPPAPPKSNWVAAAVGRVEPRGGEIRLIAPATGRIVEVAAAVNDPVKVGDLLVRLEDDESAARLAALEAEVGARKRERDVDVVKGAALERRQAEDAVAAAERALTTARNDLDEVMRAQRAGRGSSAAVEAARTALASARDKLETERQGLRRALAATGLPLPTRLESTLAAGRSDLLLAEIAHERTRVRAPIDATVLQVLARAGETAAPSADGVLVVLGDLTKLRVRAEVEERDAPKVRVGQRVVVQADAFPGRNFEGTVASLGQALGASKLGQRGPRRPTDVDVLEVMIDLADASTRPLPGMRVDVFFRPNATQSAAPAPAPKTN